MLTPADIKHRSLKTTMGGYNKKDTDEFLASILESFEELSSENAKLKEKLTSLSEGIQYYKNLEDNLQKALVLAEKTSEETKNAAKAEAANIVSLAKKEADDIVSNAQKEADKYADNAKAEFDKKVTDAQKKYEEINGRLSVLSSSYEEYKQKIKVIIKEQLDFVNGECSSPEPPENLISGEETSGINSFEKEDLVKEEKQNFIWQSVEEDDDIIKENEIDAENDTVSDIKENEIDAENDTVFDIKENEAVENINKSEVLKSEDKKQTGIEEIKYETEPKNEADNAEDDIIVENIMMKTPTINDAKEDISNTVFPASMPKDDSVSYLSGNNAGSKEKKNPFTFIDLD